MKPTNKKDSDRSSGIELETIDERSKLLLSKSDLEIADAMIEKFK